MAESQAEQTNTSRPKPRTPRRGGRGRGGHGHVANNTQGESSHGRTRQRPQTDVQAQQTQTVGGESSTPQNATGEGPSSRRRRPPRARGRDGGGGPRRNGQQRGGNLGERQSTTRTTGIGGRTFGRGLTRDEDGSEGTGEAAANGSHEQRDETEGHELRADAPEFVPGQKPEEGPSAPAPSSGEPSSTKTKSKTPKTPKTPRPQPKQKVTTKSVAPDLPTRIHEDIANNLYECPICATNSSRERMASMLLVNGAVPAAICPRMSFRQPTPAGARKRSIPAHYPASLHTLADKHVHGPAKDARIPATQPVMLGLALHGQTQQQQQLPSLGPLECDDECLRLERNRNLASALNIDIDPSTTSVNPASSRLLSSTNLPYSAETLDMYIQLSSSATLATLQNYESTLDSLARSSTQRSVRFQPAKAPLRAFVHSLAADWGFATESFDPEPHRHVFVLKPTSWAPPLFGLGTGNGMGIGGMTVGECVKVRDRERMKEREAQRAATVEAKALRDAANAAASSGAEGGWAQVASRKRSSTDATNNAAKTWGAHPASNGPTYGSYAALATDSGGGSGTTNTKLRDRLVLRSGVAQKKLQTQMEEVADSWEEEVEKEEEEVRKEMEQQQEQQSGRASPDQEKESQDVDVGDVEKKLNDLRLSTVPEGAGVTAGGDGTGN
ncbi:hypothetical protein VTN00DRAFT_3209 [Thermoascus crustaceus]|uniref:uncharacterized protein n=1 Tax=Thermoascus crustaceus TaxID=5088 RepID=UPI003743FCB4